jgi:UDP-4-amino-4,6-dideoxy-N-acetyl-beta-L-altrosamine transaminase
LNAHAKLPFLPYGKQTIEDDDIAAVTAALRSGYLTTGPLVEEFEREIRIATGAEYAIAVANGTAALHLAARAAGLIEGTLTIVPAITFLATASAVRVTGGDVIFADVDPVTGLMTPETLSAALINCPVDMTKAIIPVHLAGPSCDMAALAAEAARFNLTLIEDACHAIGTVNHDNTLAGECAHSAMACFSFHPVKTITTGEGGAITTNDASLAATLRRDRSHGMTRDANEFTLKDLAFARDGSPNPWYYEMLAPGLNYRMTDIQCALGISQFTKLPRFKVQRAKLKAAYDVLLAPYVPHIETPHLDADCDPAWHLYAVRIDFAGLNADRASVMRKMAAMGVGTQVHYIPVYRQPYFQTRYGEQTLPGAEAYYQSTLSLPLYPGMSEDDCNRAVSALTQALGL